MLSQFECVFFFIIIMYVFIDYALKFAPSQLVSETNYGLGPPPFQLDRILGILFFAFVCFFQLKSDAKLRPMMSQTKTETPNPAFRSSCLDYSDCLFAYFRKEKKRKKKNLTGSADSSPPDGLHWLFYHLQNSI